MGWSRVGTTRPDYLFASARPCEQPNVPGSISIRYTSPTSGRRCLGFAAFFFTSPALGIEGDDVLLVFFVATAMYPLQ